MNKLYYFLFILFIALSLRLYFPLISEEPFSTDAWPLIKNSEIIYEKEKIIKEDLNEREINWPASQLTLVIFSTLLGINIKHLAQLLFPIYGTFSVLLFFTFFKKMIKEMKIVFFSSLFFSIFTPHIFFSSGITKETFAYPLFILLLFLFYFLLKEKKYLIIFLLTSLALITSHHFTLFNFLLIATVFLIVYMVISLIKETKIKTTPLIALILTYIFTLIYYNSYSSQKALIDIGLNNLFILIFYQMFITIILIKILIGPFKKITFKILIFPFIILSVIFSNIYIQIIPLFFIYSTYYFSFLFIAIIILIFVLYGYKNVMKFKDYEIKIFLISLPLSMLSFYFFAVFGLERGIDVFLIQRLTNFLFILSFPLAGIGIYNLLINTKKIKRFTSITAFSFIAIFSLILMVYVYPLQINYSGYQWIYVKSEVISIEWLKTNLNDEKVFADLKMNYLLQFYEIKNHDIVQGYLILNEIIPSEEKTIIITYKLMNKNGYILTTFGENLKKNWKILLIEKYLKIYSNGNVEIYKFKK